MAIGAIAPEQERSEGISPSETLADAAGPVSLPVHSALDRLREGVPAVLGQASPLNPTVLRLLEMGMTAGTEVTVTRRAPGGDPMEIRVRGTRLCVRQADAACFPVWHASPGGRG